MRGHGNSTGGLLTRSKKKKFRAPEIDSHGQATLRVEGVEVSERGRFVDFADSELWISNGYSDKESSQIVKDLANAFSWAPKPLRRSCKQLLVLDSYAPLSGETGAACVEDDVMMIWRVKQNDNQPLVHPLIITHELAHLAGVEGGPPDQERWQQARRLDQGRSAELAEILSKGEVNHGELTYGPYKRPLSLGLEWVNQRAAKWSEETDQSEDWAISVASLVEVDRLDRGISLHGTTLDFDSIFPNRAKLIRDQLGL